MSYRDNIVITALLCQFWAPALLVDFPHCFHPLQIETIVKHKRGMTNSFYGYFHLDTPEELPERLVIRGRAGKGSNLSNFVIGINLETDTVEFANWNDLCGHQYLGSAEIGIAAIGLPGILVSMPLLILARPVYSLLERLTGMDRHTWVAYLKLKPQVASEGTLPHLKRAFIKASQSQMKPVEPVETVEE